MFCWFADVWLTGAGAFSICKSAISRHIGKLETFGQTFNNNKNHQQNVTKNKKNTLWNQNYKKFAIGDLLLLIDDWDMTWRLAINDNVQRRLQALRAMALIHG